jgi:pantothenate kinase
LASTAQDAAKKDSMGQNVGGEDQQNNDKGQTVIGIAGKPKTAKESTHDTAEEPH